MKFVTLLSFVLLRLVSQIGQIGSDPVLVICDNKKLKPTFLYSQLLKYDCEFTTFQYIDF